MPAVVSDASVLIALAVVGQLDLLREFFQKVTIPPSVWAEVATQTGRLGAEEVRVAEQQGWLRVQTPTNAALVASLRSTLDEGEAQAITLAVELKAAILLVDETDARAAARAVGLSVTGTIGVLLRAKRAGRISHLRPMLDKLLHHSFRLDQRLYAAVLKEADEST